MTEGMDIETIEPSYMFVRLLGKGRKTRNMPLCPEVCKLLDCRFMYLKDSTKQIEIMDHLYSPTQNKQLIISRLKQDYLFWEITNNNSITRGFIRVRIDLDLDYFNAYSLCHSLATYCLKDDVAITTVKEFLGHNNIRTTMIYAKTDDELKAREIKKIKPR